MTPHGGDGLAVRERIRAHALALGFDAVGFARADPALEDGDNLRRYLAEGRHGDMAWMATTAERRASPKALWPEAETAICLAVNYGSRDDPRTAQADPTTGAISVYARGRDYHDVIKPMLKRLGRWMVETVGGSVKVFVDTAPLMEKPLAQRAGLGWIGKHTNLVSRRFGSWLLLGEVLTSVWLPADAPEVDHCGSCRRCLDACPTAALPEPYRIEPRRCLSYLTIEHQGDWPADLAADAGNRIYGCDECLAVCPWNHFASPTPHPALHAGEDIHNRSLQSLTTADDAAFRAIFRGTPVRRTGYDRFVRNCLIAAGNSESRELFAAAESRTSDGSHLIRHAARWARDRLRGER